MKSVVLPETVKDIYNYAFENCSSLEAIEMPGVTRIFEGAFNACISLKTIEMPSVESIGSYASFGCSSLEAVTIPPQMEYIGYMAFCQCSQLREVVFEITDYTKTIKRTPEQSMRLIYS